MSEETICCSVSVGQNVPDFEMATYDPAAGDFGAFKLSANKEKGQWTILVFYPADFTFVCPTELKDFGDKYEALKALGCELVSVSTDTQFVHLAWQKDEPLLKDIKYPMGSDSNGSVSRLFGVLDESNGLAFRGTFIIDPDGNLQVSEVNQLPVGRNADELLRKVKACIHVRNNPTHACPAKWDEGAKTLDLTKAKDMVGKVADYS